MSSTESKRFFITLKDTEDFKLVKTGCLLECFSVMGELGKMSRRLIFFCKPDFLRIIRDYNDIDNALCEVLDDSYGSGFDSMIDNLNNNVMCFEMNPDKILSFSKGLSPNRMSDDSSCSFSRWKPGALDLKQCKMGIFYPYVFKYAWPEMFDLLVSSGFPMSLYSDLDDVVTNKIQPRSFWTDSEGEEDED